MRQRLLGRRSSIRCGGPRPRAVADASFRRIDLYGYTHSKADCLVRRRTADSGCLCRTTDELDGCSQTGIQHPERHRLRCPRLYRFSSIPDRVCGVGSFLGGYQRLCTVSPEAAGMMGFTNYDLRLTISRPLVIDPKSKIVNRQSYFLVLS